MLSESSELKFPNLPKEAREYMETGKNNQGYWTGKHVVEQVLFILTIAILIILYIHIIIYSL